jgi:hypothetical protein
MGKMEKRTVAVSVKMTPSDLDKFKKAAELLWPGAVLTQSGTILGLARLCAEDVLEKKRRGKPPGNH